MLDACGRHANTSISENGTLLALRRQGRKSPLTRNRGQKAARRSAVSPWLPVRYVCEICPVPFQCTSHV